MAILSQGRSSPRAFGLRRAGVLFGLLLAAAAIALPACFNPQQPGCAFSCAGDGLCPSGYTCGSDQLCHRDDGQGSCSIPTDAAPADAAGQ
jgi:hypothetical protein